MYHVKDCQVHKVHMVFDYEELWNILLAGCRPHVPCEGLHMCHVKDCRVHKVHTVV